MLVRCSYFKAYSHFSPGGGLIGQRPGFTIDLSQKQNSAPTSDIKIFCDLKVLAILLTGSIGAGQFTYPGAADPALTELTLNIQRGESVGFIDASGADRSTLVDIILGLLTPDSGYVTVDDIDIQNNLRNWQNQIGYVPQSTFLIDNTLRENVAFGPQMMRYLMKQSGLL